MGMVSAGCQEDVTFITGSPEPFELYGYLDPTADTQKVRIFPIEDRLAPNNGEPIDAVVTSKNLQTGEAVRWRDSLVAYDDGTYGYLFWAPFRAISGHTYHLAAQRSDGMESGSVIQIVGLPELGEPIVDDQVTLPVLFDGPQTRLRSLVLDYEIRYGWCVSEFATFSFHPTVVPTSSGFRVDVRLTENRQEIKKSLDRFRRWQVAHGLVLERITLNAVAVDAQWSPPNGTFDPEVLIDPNAMTNVRNGFGFVSSGYSLAMRAFHSPAEYGSDAPQTRLTVGTVEEAGFFIEAPDPPIFEEPGPPPLVGEPDPPEIDHDNTLCVGSWPPE